MHVAAGGGMLGEVAGPADAASASACEEALEGVRPPPNKRLRTE
jgi:hypothetical protein